MSGRVLIAEDDPSILSYLEQMLELEGYEVQGVSDGASALLAVHSFAPDMVVLDVMMPVMDGMTVLRQIRANDGGMRLPVIMLTACADDTTTWEGWRAGCDLYLSKPFEPEELLASVASLVETRRTR
ncbi:MAG: hypothetical protein NVSMB57_10830 [Actinomycetota bacterium]